jgi:hypothetical protein
VRFSLALLFSCSQYYRAFGDPTALNLALSTFRVLDDAWHTPAYGGYSETAANSIPQDLPPPSSNSTNSTSGPAALSADEAAVFDSVNSTGPGSSGEVVSASRSSRPDGAAGVGLDTAGNETRSLVVLMHGIDALSALHQVTNGEASLHAALPSP